jgi:hypothetical protein
MPDAASAWQHALEEYRYRVDLRLFADRDRFPGWFACNVDGSRDATRQFEQRFREQADRHIEVWYEVVFWKMFSQSGRRDRTARRVIENITSTGKSASDLLCRCDLYMQHPSQASLRSLVEIIWGPKGRAVAVACVFPAFLAPDRFPMVDTRVAKLSSACLARHNAADRRGPQLVAPSYPKNRAMVLTRSDWPFIEFWIQWCRHTAAKLKSRTGFDWRPRDVEMAVFRAWGDRVERRAAHVAEDHPLIELPPLENSIGPQRPEPDAQEQATIGDPLRQSEAVMKFQFSRHAEWELARRQAPRALLESVLETPEQRLPQPDGKVVYQSRVAFEGGRMYLLRAVLSVERNPPVVVTVYRTSKIEKYWRPE